MRSESGGLGTFGQTLRHGVGQQRVAADGVSRHAFFKRLRRSRRCVPMPRPANNEGQMIENAPLNVLRSLDPNVAPESAIGCNTFSPMHLSGLNAANRKTKVWPFVAGPESASTSGGSRAGSSPSNRNQAGDRSQRSPHGGRSRRCRARSRGRRNR